MILTLKEVPMTSMIRGRITPDPDQAAELERRINALSYRPENGFHRDRRQHRREPPAQRLPAPR